MSTKQTKRKDKYIILNENNIYVYRLDHPACVSHFIRCVTICIQKGVKYINIIFRCGSIFPNACLPIAGLIQYYQDRCGLVFNSDIPATHYLSSCGFMNPLFLSPDDIKADKHPFDKIICYENSTQVSELTQTYINAISRSSECASGVIESLIWCLNEVLDNVLLHSESDRGYILVQYHPTTKHIAICIFDYGIGIYQTLKSTLHKPCSTLDALSLSLQEGVGDGKGQGNGLFGLYGIVDNNKGQLTLTSGDASIFFRSGEELKKFENLPIVDSEHHCTIVDFQLNLSTNVELTKIFKSIGGFDGFDIRLDEMITENDFYHYDVFSNCTGTATRDAGKASYNDVLNIFTRTQAPIILDFSNVQNVSSSYIDEFVAKLVVKTGFYKFNQMFRLVGMNSTIEHLCNRAVAMRIYGEWVNL